LSAVRAFWLTLFAIGAVTVLVAGVSGGQPWTAAAFVVFFTSRVARSEIKRHRVRRWNDDAPRRAKQFMMVTVAGWLGAGTLAMIAAIVGEGQEWLFVAPFFLLMGAINFYITLK